MHGYGLGMKWFERAENLGAASRTVDHDIEALLACMSEAEITELIALLLAHDQGRYASLRSVTTGRDRWRQSSH